MQGDPGAFGAANAHSGNQNRSGAEVVVYLAPRAPARALQGTYPCRPRDHNDASQAGGQPTKISSYLRFCA